MLKIKKENENLKEKTGQMKFHIEELKELRKMVKVQKTIERKWVETLFTYKQQEALNSQVKALTQEKKRENVLIDMELINLKNASMFNFEEIRRRTSVAKIEKLVGKNKEHRRNPKQLQAQLESANERKKSLDPICVKKIRIL